MSSYKILDADALSGLRGDADASPRRRAALQIHEDHADPVQRVLMAANPDTFVGPHRHPDKAWEMMILVDGALDILMFTEDGELEKRVPLRAGGNRIIEYPADRYHAAVVLEPGTTVLEVKEGPYDAKTAKDMPAWAPDEQSADAADFNARMRTLQPGDRLG